MQPNVASSIVAAWIVTFLVWLAGALRTKKAVRTASFRSRLVHNLLASVALLLLFNSALAIGPLAWRFVPEWAAIQYTGLAFTLAGTGLAIWARVFLGRNWSAIVTIKEDHRLIQSGPYALVRHPIYAGFLLAMLGTALAWGQVRGLLAVALAFFAWSFKLRLEEKFMEQRFGSEYTAYKRSVKALIPFVW